MAIADGNQRRRSPATLTKSWPAHLACHSVTAVFYHQQHNLTDLHSRRLTRDPSSPSCVQSRIENKPVKQKKMNFGGQASYNQQEEDDDEEGDSDDEMNDYGSGSGSGHISNGIENLIASAPLLLSTTDTNWTTSPYYAAAMLGQQASLPFQSMAMGMQPNNNNNMGEYTDLNSYASHSHYPLSHYPTSSYHQPPPLLRTGKATSSSSRSSTTTGSRAKSSGVFANNIKTSKATTKSNAAAAAAASIQQLSGSTGIKLAPPLWVYAEGCYIIIRDS